MRYFPRNHKKIRSTKSEIRNNLNALNSNVQNGVLDFGIPVFVFVSDFDIRISNLKA
jgi:hypothetical protein